MKEGQNKEYKKGLWTKEEDRILSEYVRAHGRGHWNRIPKVTGLKRCGKSCRLRWLNYLCPNVKLGDFSQEEEDLIIRLHKLLGNRWSLIAGRVPGRTDNQVKNYCNTHLRKKLGIKRSEKGKNKAMSSSQTMTLDEAASQRHEEIASTPEDALNAGRTSTHCFESVLFADDHNNFNVNSPGFLEFLEGFSFEF